MMPDFIIIGAAKAGTTALYESLRQHPQIGMSHVKEPNFFALENQKLNYKSGTTSPGYLEECVTDIDTYRRQFKKSREDMILGEASPLYLYAPEASERIKFYMPEAKIIAILRDPVERAYSNYLHHIREGLEPIASFEDALNAEEKRRQENWWWGFSYVQAGLYYTQIKRYYEKFPSRNLKIVLYDDFLKKPAELVQEIFRFLEVDQSFISDTAQRYNVTGIPQNRNVWNFITKTHPIKEPFKKLLPSETRKRLNQTIRSKILQKPKLPLEVRAQLIEVFSQEILNLQDLLQRDLSHWLKV